MNIKNIFIAFSFIFMLALPHVTLATNDFVLDADTHFSLMTADTGAPTTLVGLNGARVVSLSADTSFLEITMENGSSITFDSNDNLTFTAIKQSGSGNFTARKSCPTNSMSRISLSATDTVVLRLQVSSLAVCPLPPPPDAVPLFLLTTAPTLAQKSDVNTDGTIDLGDFAAMLFHWRSTEQSEADINEDGIVDLTDFSILIFNWTP